MTRQDLQERHAENFTGWTDMFRPAPLAYCDYIAHQIHKALDTLEPGSLVSDVGRVKWDLHPDGYMLSTKKTLDVMDRNGRKYRVTVEEIL